MKRKGKKTFRGTPAEHLSSAAKQTKMVKNLANTAQKFLKQGKCEVAFWKIIAMSEELGAVESNLGWSKKIKRTKASESKVNRTLEEFNRRCLR